MTFTIIAVPDVEAAFRKLKTKDAARFEQIVKKLREIGENPETGKPLRRPLQGRWRIHIGHHVLIYTVDKKKERIILLKFSHHDEAY